MRRNFLIALAAVVWGSAAIPLGAQDMTDVTMAGTQMREDDLPSLAAAPDGSLWLAWLAYADRRDEIAIRQWKDGTWGNLRYVPNTSGDCSATTILAGGDNYSCRFHLGGWRAAAGARRATASLG